MGYRNCRFLLRLFGDSRCRMVTMVKECAVQQIQCLDDEGYWMKRTIFLNMESPIFVKGLAKVVNDKTIPNTYTTIRRVLNA